MVHRLKTGGRKAGTPNKRTVEIAEKLETLGCDPLEGMARLAMDEANPPELRGRMFAELAQYVAPKRRAVEVSEPDSRDELSALPLEELIGRVQGLLAQRGHSLPTRELPDPTHDDSSAELHQPSPK